MSAYAKYLVSKLKDIDENCYKIVIVPCYVDMEGNSKWELPHNDNDKLYKKCILFGYESSALWHARFISSSSKAIWGHSIKFQYNWNTNERQSIDSNDLDGVMLLENIFMQCMAISECHDIYLDKKLLFAKGSAYEHMMLAELTI